MENNEEINNILIQICENFMIITKKAGFTDGDESFKIWKCNFVLFIERIIGKLRAI